MNQIILSGARIEDLLLRIEQIIDNRLSSLAPPQPSQSEYLSRAEVAKLLKITLPTLHDWTKLGWLQSYKIGNRVLYKKTEVENTVDRVATYKHKKGGMR